MLAQANSFRGFKAIGIFLFFGAAMASLAGATLIWRGSFLDRLWALNARAYHQLAPFGSEAGVAFLVLGAVLVVAGRGWFLRRSWGWGLTAVLVASQTVGSAVNAILGDFSEGAIGSILAGAILYFLLRPQVRTAFRRRASPERRVV
jgi:hypothetical protein